MEEDPPLARGGAEPMEEDPPPERWEPRWGVDWQSDRTGAPIRVRPDAIPDLSPRAAWAALSARRVRNEWERARAEGVRRAPVAQQAWETGDQDEMSGGWHPPLEIAEYDRRSSARRARHRGARDDLYGAAGSEDSDPDDPWGERMMRHSWVRWRDPTEVVQGEARSLRAGHWPRRSPAMFPAMLREEEAEHLEGE